MGRTQFWILGSQCHCTLCIAHCALFIVQATTGQFRPKLDQTREYGEYDDIKEEPPKGEPPKDTLTQWHWTWTCTGLWVLDSISFSLVLFPASSCLLKATWYASNCNIKGCYYILCYRPSVAVYLLKVDYPLVLPTLFGPSWNFWTDLFTILLNNC